MRQDRVSSGPWSTWTVVCLENWDYALAIRRVLRSWRDAVDVAEVREAR
jgi:hypothetical protein